MSQINNSSSSGCGFASANCFAPLKNVNLYNRTSLPDLFVPKDLVEKTKKYKVTGNTGQPGPNTMDRAGLMAARLVAEPATPPPTCQVRRSYPPSRPRKPAQDPLIESQVHLAQIGRASCRERV